MQSRMGTALSHLLTPTRITGVPIEAPEVLTGRVRRHPAPPTGDSANDSVGT